jgi:hypothetical protein
MTQAEAHGQPAALHTQKQIVEDAMAVDGREFASWARELLVTNAQAILERSKQRNQRKPS